jgi:hypothetical protein
LSAEEDFFTLTPEPELEWTWAAWSGGRDGGGRGFTSDLDVRKSRFMTSGVASTGFIGATAKGRDGWWRSSYIEVVSLAR